MVKATVTNNSVGVGSVYLDVNDKTSEVQLPPKSRGTVFFKDEASFEAAKEAANQNKPKLIYIAKEA